MKISHFLLGCAIVICIGRYYKMQQKKGMLKGIGVGMALGAVTAAVIAAKTSQSQATPLRRSAQRAARAVGDFAGNMGHAVVDTVSHAAK